MYRGTFYSRVNAAEADMSVSGVQQEAVFCNGRNVCVF